MTDEITPARLRELAQRHEQNAADLREYEEACRAAGSWRDDQEQMITPESEEETAAALRAAASTIEEEHKRVDTAGDLVAGMNEENLRLTATLAAREALLKRAGQWLAGDAMVFAALAENVLREAPACDERAQICRALAAEIAAALKETDNG